MDETLKHIFFLLFIFGGICAVEIYFTLYVGVDIYVTKKPNWKRADGKSLLYFSYISYIFI